MRIIHVILILGLLAPISSEAWEKTYNFSVSKQNFTVTLSMSDEEMESCLSKIKIWQKEKASTSHSGRFHTSQFLSFPCSDDLIRSLNSQLHDIYKENFETKEEEIYLFMAFVNSIPYKAESNDYRVADYWQFPFETLLLNAGDCEDHAFLLANLFYRNGYKSILIETKDHMACGINAAGIQTEHNDPHLINYNGDKYYYCEPGGSSSSVNKIGEIGVSGGCIPTHIGFVEPKNQFDRSGRHNSDYVDLNSRVGGTIQIGVNDQNLIYYNQTNERNLGNGDLIMDSFNERMIIRDASPFIYEKAP
jgi:hypothetical protein